MPTTAPKDSRATNGEVYDHLRRRLLSLEFRPGEKLRAPDLAKSYDCAANTIRDVLLRLSAAGLVTFEEQRGFRTAEASLERCRDVTNFRILLEQEGLCRSIRNGGVLWEAQITAAHHKLSHIEKKTVRNLENSQNASPSGPMRIWSDAEWEFHDTLMSACGSDVLRETYRNVYDTFRQQTLWQQRDFGADYFKAIVVEHEAILQAALARDETACRKAVYDHLKRNLFLDRDA